MGSTLALLIDLLCRPRETLACIKEEGRFRDAVLILVFCQSLNSIIWSAEEISIFFKAALLFIQLIVAIFFWAFAGGVWHFGAKLLGGTGEYKNLLKLTAFTSFLNVINLPFYLLTFVFPAIGLFHVVAVSSLISLWIIALQIISIQENYELSILKSCILYVMPVAFLIACAAVLALLLIAGLGFGLENLDDAERILEKGVQI